MEFQEYAQLVLEMRTRQQAYFALTRAQTPPAQRQKALQAAKDLEKEVDQVTGELLGQTTGDLFQGVA